MTEQTTPEQEQEVTSEVDAFPVSFCVIATQDDFKENAMNMIRSLPANAQICVLFNQAGDEEHLSDVTVKTSNGRTLRSQMWTYKHDQFSFAKARNLSGALATKEWIFWIDCDEVLAQAQHDGIKEATTVGAGVGGFMCGQASHSMYEKLLNTGQSGYINTGQCRLYRNRQEMEWIGHAHEQIVPSIRNAGFSIIDSTITVIHNGYSVDQEKLVKKLERNTSLIGRWLHENGSSHDMFKFFRALYARDIQGQINMEKLQCQSMDM
jgi:hypothetical protein